MQKYVCTLLNMITVFIPEGGAPELVDHIKDNFTILNKFIYKMPFAMLSVFCVREDAKKRRRELNVRVRDRGRATVGTAHIAILCNTF